MSKHSTDPTPVVEQRRTEIVERLAKLQSLFTTYGTDAADWGHAGSMGHAVSELTELCRTFGV